MTPRIAISLMVVLALVEQGRAQAPGQMPAEPSQTMPAPATQLVEPAAPVGDHSILPDWGVPVCNCRDHCWAYADYLIAWTRGNSLPPLVTTSPPGTAQAAAGVLGQPGTTILFGNSTVDGDVRSGIRLGAGGWFDDRHLLGIDVGFSVLESQSAVFTASSQGNPILARPFSDVTNNNVPTSQLIAFPALSTGSVNASDRGGNFYDLHIDFQEALYEEPNFRLVPMLGYRFLRTTTQLAIDTSVTAVGGAGVVPGTQILTADRFTAQNNFNGGDFGLKTEFLYGSWSVDLLTKLAVGRVDRSIGIHGNTQTTVPGVAPAGFNGGFLALSSNTGVFNSDDWVVVPEVGTGLSWRASDHICLNLGYSFLYWSKIANAGDQVNFSLNPNLFPPPRSTGTTPVSPTFNLQKSEIWVQSVNLGLEFRY
jgi:hypothetical protein